MRTKSGFVVGKTVNTSVQQPQNESTSFFTSEGDAEIAATKALFRLIIQLQEARNDTVSYTEGEVYNIFEVEEMRM